jgi:Tfp pilus assembly protein PilF
MRSTWLPALAGALIGCTTLDQERLRDYSDDGAAMFRCGRYDDARDSFEAALRLKPSDPGLLYNIGQCQDRGGDPAGAERAYRACLEIAPDHPPCRQAQAALLVRLGRRDEAGRIIEDWLGARPQLAAAYALDGWYWRQAGDLPRAQSRLQQALERDPKDMLALTELAQVYEALERPDRALALYRRALDLDPKQAGIADRVNALLARGAVLPRPE